MLILKSFRPSGYEFNNTILPVSPYVIIFAQVIFRPVYEEIMLRLSLKFDKRYLLISAGSITLYLLLRHEFKHLFTSTGNNFEFRLTGAIACILILFGLFKNPVVIERLRSVWERNLYAIITLSLVGDGLIHVGRFPGGFGPPEVIIMTWVVFSAFVYCYVRLKASFLWAIILHILTNGVPYLIVLFETITTGKNYIEEVY
jgi:hypothetical protein